MSERAWDVVTERVVEMLGRGVVPWRRPWRPELCGGVANLVSGRAYSGVNAMLLPALGYGSRYFLTFNQCKALGGRVIPGSKAAPVVFWKFLDVKDEKAPKGRKVVPMLRYFSVFNAEQCEGLPGEALKKHDVAAGPFEPISACEGIVKGYAAGPRLEHIGARACYMPSLDVVRMPAREAFETREAYYRTLFHELTHSTGHKSRLGRKFGDRFGTEEYSREELVAEMGAAFLCTEARIDPDLEQSAAYVASWKRFIEEDGRAIVVAAGAAQKAANLILGRGAVAEIEVAA